MQTMLLTRDDFTKAIAADPAVAKALGLKAKRKPTTVRLKRQEALKRSHKAIRQFLAHDAELTTFKKRRIAGKKLRPGEENEALAHARSAEGSFRESMKHFGAFVAGNRTVFEPVVAAANRRTADAAFFSHPCFMSLKEAKVARDTGLNLSHASLAYDDAVLGRFSKNKAKRSTMSHKQLVKAIDRMSRTAVYGDSPLRLVQRGYVTLEGAGFFDFVLAVVDAVAAVVAAVVTVAATIAVIIAHPTPLGVIAAGAIFTTGMAVATGFADAARAAANRFNLGNSLAAYPERYMLSSGQSPPPQITGMSGSVATMLWAGQSPPQITGGTTSVPAYGLVGNLSRSKREVHQTFCPWLHLIDGRHIGRFDSLASAHSAGLDNCAYCIGGSKR
jgi:hypothetical protein